MITDRVSYRGPSRVMPLSSIRNEEGFKFIGIDKEGNEHDCIVRKGDSNSYYMSSDTVLFGDLIGWLHGAKNDETGRN